MTPEKIKILFFDHSPVISGAEYSLLDILQGLNNGPRDCHLLTVKGGQLIRPAGDLGVTIHGISLSDRILSISKHGLQKGPWKFLTVSGEAVKAVISICRLLRREKFDIIYTNSLKSHILGGLAGRAAGVKVIWHVRDIPVHKTPARMIRIFSAFLPDRIIAVSEAASRPFDASKVSIIYNGIDTDKVHKMAAREMPAEIKRILRNSKNCQFIGIVGQIARWKGQDVFLRAVRLLAGKLPRAKFLIIGESLFLEQGFKQELENFVAGNKIQKRVVFTGQLENVYPLMQRLDILVHSSIEPEPFGRVIIEAMALGVPVIAARGGASDEIIRDGDDGLLVSPGAHGQLAGAIERLLADKPLRKRIINNGSIRVRRAFGLKEMLDKISDLIHQMPIE